MSEKLERWRQIAGAAIQAYKEMGGFPGSGYATKLGEELDQACDEIATLEAERAMDAEIIIEQGAKLEAMERKRDLYAQLATFYSAREIAASQPPDYGLAIYALRDLPLTEEFQLRDLAWAHHREGNTSKSDWEYFRDEWVERWRQALVAQQEVEK